MPQLHVNVESKDLQISGDCTLCDRMSPTIHKIIIIYRVYCEHCINWQQPQLQVWSHGKCSCWRLDHGSYYHYLCDDCLKDLTANNNILECGQHA